MLLSNVSWCGYKCHIATWWWHPLWIGLWANPELGFPRSFLAPSSLSFRKAELRHWPWLKDLCTIWFLGRFGQREHWQAGVGKSGGYFFSSPWASSHCPGNNSLFSVSPAPTGLGTPGFQLSPDKLDSGNATCCFYLFRLGAGMVPALLNLWVTFLFGLLVFLYMSNTFPALKSLSCK